MNFNQPEVSLKVGMEHGLTAEEYERIKSILGREPNYTELGIFSVMWSEHCSYKNSILELKKLPRTGKRLLVGAGEENAGLVDIGDGLAVAFKIESHNHPSAVEPFQGAATGVGGIMRDIFTMGARPIASLNSLRFGNPHRSRTKHLLKEVVKGIGNYGNSFGVPTVAGEIYFDECYNDNPLVNAMAVGIVRRDRVAKAIAHGKGNLVVIVGSSTGRDGIHGATFASEEISEKSESKRPSVQVGDPFTEKLLLEATLEAIESGYVIGIQDMGAAGITCSTSEMSSKGKSGMMIDLTKVPTRELHMTPYEIMLSESQERMLLIIAPEHEKEVQSIFNKWDLHCTVIGTVESSNKLKVEFNSTPVADVPPEYLVLGGEAPVYIRESRRPSYLDSLYNFDDLSINEPTDYSKTLITLLQSPNICSRRWVTQQYDSMVRTDVMQICGDAAVVRIKGTRKALAMKTDCNSRYVYLNPYRGAVIAVAEAARNVVCTGATPLAITNCLNFGNPYDPEIYWQFKETIRGISDACSVLNTPVTGGNVSFYNEGPEGAIHPTPVIGMLGEIENVSNMMTSTFKVPGDVILLLGSTKGHLGGSEYLKVIHNKVVGDAPEINLQLEKRLQGCCQELIQKHRIKSAHDLSEGGLAVALVESCIMNFDEHLNLGACIRLEKMPRKDMQIFGEDQSRVLISASRANFNMINDICASHNVAITTLGEVTSGKFQIENVLELSLTELREAYYGSLERLLIKGHSSEME